MLVPQTKSSSMQPYVVPYLFRFLHPAVIICIPHYIPQYFVYIFRYCAFKFSSEFIKQLNNRWPCDMTVMFRNIFNIFPTNYLFLSSLLSLSSLFSFIHLLIPPIYLWLQRAVVFWLAFLCVHIVVWLLFFSVLLARRGA